MAAGQEWVTAGFSPLRAEVNKKETKPPDATAVSSQRGGECSSSDVFYKGTGTQRSAGDPPEIRRDLCAPEEPMPGQEFLKWLQAAHARAGTPLKKGQWEELVHKSPRLPMLHRACQRHFDKSSTIHGAIRVLSLERR